MLIRQVSPLQPRFGSAILKVGQINDLAKSQALQAEVKNKIAQALQQTPDFNGLNITYDEQFAAQNSLMVKAPTEQLETASRLLSGLDGMAPLGNPQKPFQTGFSYTSPTENYTIFIRLVDKVVMAYAL